MEIAEIERMEYESMTDEQLEILSDYYNNKRLEYFLKKQKVECELARRLDTIDKCYMLKCDDRVKYFKPLVTQNKATYYGISVYISKDKDGTILSAEVDRNSEEESNLLRNYYEVIDEDEFLYAFNEVIDSFNKMREIDNGREI